MRLYLNGYISYDKNLTVQVSNIILNPLNVKLFLQKMTKNPQEKYDRNIYPLISFCFLLNTRFYSLFITKGFLRKEEAFCLDLDLVFIGIFVVVVVIVIIAVILLLLIFVLVL